MVEYIIPNSFNPKLRQINRQIVPEFMKSRKQLSGFVVLHLSTVQIFHYH